MKETEVQTNTPSAVIKPIRTQHMGRASHMDPDSEVWENFLEKMTPSSNKKRLIEAVCWLKGTPGRRKRCTGVCVEKQDAYGNWKCSVGRAEEHICRHLWRRRWINILSLNLRTSQLLSQPSSFQSETMPNTHF